MTALLHVDDVVLDYGSRRRGLLSRRPSAPVRAIDGATLEVREGETLGLVGESGCGKSSLARCVVGLVPPTGGHVRFRGHEVDPAMSPADRRRVQMVFQDPYSSLNPRMRIGAALDELLRVHKLRPREQVSARSRELLSMVGLPRESYHYYPHQLSGGGRQRVSIARALALEPELIVADEAVSALDVSVRATILNLLMELKREFGLTLLFISHDLSVVRHLCDRIAVMYLGRVVEVAPAQELFEHPQHPYTRGLLAAVPSLDPAKRNDVPALTGDLPSPRNIPSGCRFRSRCPLAADVCAREDPALATAGASAEHLAACHFAGPDPLAEPATT